MEGDGWGMKGGWKEVERDGRGVEGDVEGGGGLSTVPCNG